MPHPTRMDDGVEDAWTGWDHVYALMLIDPWIPFSNFPMLERLLEYLKRRHGELSEAGNIGLSSTLPGSLRNESSQFFFRDRVSMTTRFDLEDFRRLVIDLALDDLRIVELVVDSENADMLLLGPHHLKRMAFLSGRSLDERVGKYLSMQFNSD